MDKNDKIKPVPSVSVEEKKKSFLNFEFFGFAINFAAKVYACQNGKCSTAIVQLGVARHAELGTSGIFYFFH